MNFRRLVRRNLTYFWRTNLAVVAGVGVVIAVLAGALLVGASVRGSLRDLALLRLGNVDQVVTSGGFFREALAAPLRSASDPATTLSNTTPLIVLEGFVTHQNSGRRAAGVQVYGVDERFWRFHGRDPLGRVPETNDVLLSEGLARELGGMAGDALLVRVEKPSAIPVSSLHGQKDDLGRTVRLLTRAVLSPEELGEFSFRPQQGLARSVFVSLQRLQRDLDRPGQVNAILLGAGRSALGAGGRGSQSPGGPATARVKIVEEALRELVQLEDLGIKLRALPTRGAILMESEAGLLSDAVAEAGGSTADALGMRVQPILTYLANRIRLGDREIPYSLLTALDLDTILEAQAPGPRPLATSPAAPDLPPIVLNEWAADELAAESGDLLSIEYYVWADEGRLLTREEEFRVASVVPLAGAAADRDLAPEYPGITQADSVFEWDPPFPIDLGLVGPRDEEYWDRYRTTPKGFIPLVAGQALWQSRWGNLTSLRVFPPEGPLEPALQTFGNELRASLDPITSGFGVYPARALALEASVGATDFGEYFTYFSFFLVVSALLLASLFFRLGVEQRLREIGMFRAFGFPPSRIRVIFWSEALILSAAGSVVGMAGAIAYADVIMYGLRTWWVDAVGTTLLTLHVSPGSLLLGAAGGTLAAVVSIALTLKTLARATPRSLLAGSLPDSATGLRGYPGETTREGSEPTGTLFSQLPRRFSSLMVAIILAAVGLALLGGALLGVLGDTAGFFGAGTLLLCALLTAVWTWLRRRVPGGLQETGTWSVARLGFRNAGYRPGRSVLCISLIASAAFIIVAVDAFRREGSEVVLDRASGTGGYTLLADSTLPLVHDPDTEAGREELYLADLEDDVVGGVSFARFRVRPGEDASCLNLYQAKDPRILAPTGGFVRSGRFAFRSSLARDEAERENPWLLLEQEQPDGAIPAIADATSLTYVLHLGVGDEFILNRDTDQPIHLRIVAALADSIFQRELLISERHFLDLFPSQEGYRFFLLDAAPEAAAAVTVALEDRLSDFGFDVVSTGERMAAFHRVENTYLATFQLLGGLGLLLGTLGLAAVLLRNVLERRRELALLRAVGYNSTHLSIMVLAENAFLLFFGLVTGTVCALLAIAPAWLERGGQPPVASLGGLLAAVALTGLAASVLATAAALRAPLLPSLRAE